MTPSLIINGQGHGEDDDFHIDNVSLIVARKDKHSHQGIKYLSNPTGTRSKLVGTGLYTYMYIHMYTHVYTYMYIHMYILVPTSTLARTGFVNHNSHIME